MNSENLRGNEAAPANAEVWDMSEMPDFTLEGPSVVEKEAREQEAISRVENDPMLNTEILQSLDAFRDGLVTEERGRAGNEQDVARAEQMDIVMSAAIESARVVSEMTGGSVAQALKNLYAKYQERGQRATNQSDARISAEGENAVKQLILWTGTVVDAEKNASDGLKPDVELR